MLTWSTAAIAECVAGKSIGDDVAVQGVSIDTRTLQAQQLYVAIKGKNFDGHDFVTQAEQAGAAAILTERPLTTVLPQIMVADSHRALAELAGAWRDSLPIKVAGVTGSNGKTTVKEMIAAILAVAAQVSFTRSNLNNDIGVPLTLLKLTPEDRYAVIEMGANHAGEIAYSAHYAKPDVAVISNVGAAHIEGFGSLEGTARAKGEIISTLDADGIAVLNRDDRFFNVWAELAGSRKIVTFGLQQPADVTAVDCHSGLEGSAFATRFQLLSPSGEQAIRLNLAGRHNIANALAAAAVCEQFGIGLEQIAVGLANLQPVTGRLQPLFGKQGNLVIDDTYNANPSSLQAALEVLKTCNGEPWLALGAFGELGPDSPDLHRQMGEQIRQMGITRLFATGELCRHTVSAFGTGAEFFEDQQALIDSLSSAATGRETILIKGSRAQKMENVAAALVENYRAPAC